MKKQLYLLSASILLSFLLTSSGFAQFSNPITLGTTTMPTMGSCPAGSTPITTTSADGSAFTTCNSSSTPKAANNSVLCDPNGSAIQGSVVDGTTTDCTSFLNNGSVNSGSGTTVNVNVGNSSSATDACREAWKDSNTNCISGGPAAQMAMMAQMMARNVGAGTSATAACTSLKAQGLTSLAGAGGIWGACQAALSDCNSSCSDNSTYLKRCAKIKNDVYMAMAPMLVGAGGAMLSAENCEQQIAAQEAVSCDNPNNYASFNCNSSAYCAQHTLDSRCTNINTMAACANPATAAGNPLCGAGAGSDALPIAKLNNGAGSDDDPNRAYQGYQRGAPAAGGGESASGGGGGGFGGPGAYPGGSNGPGGGGRDAGIKTDIGGGYGGGTGGGSVAMGNSMNGNGGNGRGGSDDKLDLSRFLPNGDLANRGLASVNDLLNKGITGANDLSNFEKVTRMMNQKRKVLAE